MFKPSRCKGTKIFSNMQIIFYLFENLRDFWTILYVYIVYCLRQFMGCIAFGSLYRYAMFRGFE